MTQQFKFPFKVYEGGNHVFDNTGQVVMQFNDESSDTDRKNIMELVNGNNVKTNWNPTYDKESFTIFVAEGLLLEMRGWGFLTGVKKLTGDKAAEIQDTLALEIVNRIKKSC